MKAKAFAAQAARCLPCAVMAGARVRADVLADERRALFVRAAGGDRDLRDDRVVLLLAHAGADALEQFAMQNRLDIQAAKLQTQGVASSLGLSKATRVINALDVGYP
ncbi:hypothetical protein [Burkholderia cepacia]|uniref:hypothetical protein n=1 Tax=Burkholderia cepacia TaxID=292 RepID=UPI0012DADFEF|nr:hypothetical protein [Burkholderia cepacia]